jgi:hypothetical protein
LAAARRVQLSRSPAELKAVLEAARARTPFLVWRSAGDQQILSLDGLSQATVGRRVANDVVLAEDDEVSRIHAKLECVAGEWTVSDEGLSRNGTFVNTERITQKRRLRDGDILRLGATIVEFRRPGDGSGVATRAGAAPEIVAGATLTQRRILIALCRPYKSGDAYPAPATSKEIAAELFLSVDAVKHHLRVLYQKFGIADLPQNQKRVRLVECAFQWGLVSDLDV